MIQFRFYLYDLYHPPGYYKVQFSLRCVKSTALLLVLSPERNLRSSIKRLMAVPSAQYSTEYVRSVQLCQRIIWRQFHLFTGLHLNHPNPSSFPSNGIKDILVQFRSTDYMAISIHPTSADNKMRKFQDCRQLSSFLFRKEGNSKEKLVSQTTFYKFSMTFSCPLFLK